ncbi:MAG: transketolase [Actinobacteria bacterium]|nr:transketolase [Actinomycetota bacterium]
MKDLKKIEKLSKLIRYYILVSTTRAGSGHPTSSLSAVELMSTLFFGGFFRFDPEHPDHINNDRLIFSKGHASPLLYSLWAAAGTISESKLLTLREFDSELEGHPTPRFKYAEAATGSLGQGLSIGLGMALSAKYIDKLSYRTYVLLGDSEMAEGSGWEAIQIASYYKLNNLIAILDVNRLGQRGETMLGRGTGKYEERVKAFGWKTIQVNGHSIEEIDSAYTEALSEKDRPIMIIADTIKGKGVSFIEDIDGWHGKVLSEDQKDTALAELGEIDKSLTGEIAFPDNIKKAEYRQGSGRAIDSSFPEPGELISTREAYGRALVNIFEDFPDIVVLDAEVSNSTYSKIFKDSFPERFFEMFIAEQNMVGTASGMSLRGKIPFVSTFAAFFSRAFDQIRMSQYSKTNIKFSGSHSGVSIGPDGASQMGLEDIAMFRTLIDCSVFYPCDAVSTEALVRLSASFNGNVYIRTTRMKTPVIYNDKELFRKGGSKVLKESSSDMITVCAAGITLHEALKAHKDLLKENINIRVIDVYSIKPIDEKTIRDASLKTKAIITVEDHFPEGGLGEAVCSIINIGCPVHILAVRKMPRSGKPEQLLNYESISREAIIKKVREIIGNRSDLLTRNKGIF